MKNAKGQEIRYSTEEDFFAWAKETMSPEECAWAEEIYRQGEIGFVSWLRRRKQKTPKRPCPWKTVKLGTTKPRRYTGRQ